MSLFQCENCGAAENTALSMQGIKGTEEWYKWDFITDRKGKKLCSECAPIFFEDGSETGMGKWHGQFDKIILPMGEFKTNSSGNLENIHNGDTDYRKYAMTDDTKR